MTIILKPAVTADVGPSHPGMSVSGGEIILDAMNAPYGTARVDLPMGAGLDDLDPRNPLRVVLKCRDALSTDPIRTLNLGMRAREVDSASQRITMDLATDEALLMDYAPLAEDAGARASQASLRAVCNYVLGKIGAALASGGPDADVTAYWRVTNLVANPGVDGGSVAPWTSGGNCTPFYSTGWADAPQGTTAIGWNSNAAGLLAVTMHPTNQGPSVTPGKSYVWSFYARQYQASPQRTMYACLRWLNNQGIPVGPDVQAAPANMSSTAWVRYSLIATAPAGASRAEVFFRSDGYTAANQIAYADAAMFHEGNELVPYFDGSTPANANYTYTWAGTAWNSASTRNPVVTRDPDLYVWKPGMTGWDFLEPFTSSAGFRLFCDESRVWRLIDPGTYSVPGIVSLAAWNSTQARDTISREDSAVFCTGVVVRYGWTDRDGITRTAYDAAGTPSRVFVVDMTRAYPGPGAAAAILARRNGTGRTQDVTAVVKWTTTPGMEGDVSTTYGNQKGKISQVRFLLEQGLMDVGTRGLIDIPSNSWLAVPASEKWTDPPALSWNQWV